MSLSVHIDNKNKEILILGGGLTQGLDDNWLTAEAKCPINFKQSRKRMETTVSYLLTPKNISVQSIRRWSNHRCGSEVKSYDKETKTILKNIISEYNLCCICESVNYESIICFYILRAFLLITIALLIAASIYWYLIKYKSKQKHLLRFYVTKNKFKEVLS